MIDPTPEIRAEMDALARGNDPNGNAAGTTEARAAACGPVLRCMADVEALEVSWLWPDRIPLGCLTLLAGVGGIGKTYLTTYLGANVSLGRTWTDGAPCPRGSVLFLLGEDDAGYTIRPRLEAHGADLSRTHELMSVKRIDTDTGEPCELAFTLADVDALERALASIPDVRLVVVDPVGTYIGGRVDAHRDNEVRSVLAPVARLAARHGIAVLLVGHTRKAAVQTADDAVMGSRAFVNLSRAVWHMRRDRDDKTRRLLVPGKQNLGPMPDGLAFTIGGHPPAILWEPDPITLSADEAVAAENIAHESGEGASALDEAVAFLRNALADGPRKAEDVKREATKASISARTLERARGKLGVLAGPDGFQGPWSWRLPPGQAAQCSPDSTREETLANSGKSGELLGNPQGVTAGDPLDSAAPEEPADLEPLPGIDPVSGEPLPEELDL